VLHESLWRAWSVQKRAVPIIPALYFSPDGLALGAGTILLPAMGPRRLANLQREEARLLALLSATYGKAISPSVLGNIERAAKSWRDGDDTAAVIHLAHAGLPRPDDPDEAARRLFVTDAFIKAGTSPIGILQALGLEASYVGTVAKLYNEFEPRVPPGNGILSGRRTKILSLLGDLTASQAEHLLTPLAVGAGAVEVFRLIFVPSPNRIRVEGDIAGLPGGHYSWNRDEAQVHINYRTAEANSGPSPLNAKATSFLGHRDRSPAPFFPTTMSRSTATLSREGPQMTTSQSFALGRSLTKERTTKALSTKPSCARSSIRSCRRR
jgi:hypothetical protein